jgi:pimeloyl-ACP methyl ester carboxylesterase
MNPIRILTDFRSFAFLAMVTLCTIGILNAQEPTLDLAERTVDVHGDRIAYRIGGDGPPLLFVHGFTMTGEQWDQFLDALGARHTVIIPDLPAHGRSNDISGEFRYSDMATRLFSLLDTLGIDSISAIGQSAGASILVHMAVQQPLRMKAIVLVAGSHRLVAAGREMLGGLHLEDLPKTYHDYYRRYHPGGESQTRSLFVRLRALADNYDDFDFSPERLATIRAKTLLVWGDRDFAYPVEIALEMYRAIPNASLWVIPDQGHTPVWTWLGGSKEAEAIFPNVVLKFIADEDL